VQRKEREKRKAKEAVREAEGSLGDKKAKGKVKEEEGGFFAVENNDDDKLDMPSNGKAGYKQSLPRQNGVKQLPKPS